MLSLILSVVVPVRNEGAYLRRTVEGMLATLPEQSELIVVDNGSEDGCARFLYRRIDPRVRLVHKPALGVAAARNVGGALAQGELLVFADAHVDVWPNWWEELATVLQDEAVGAVAPVISQIDQPGAKGYGMRFCDAALGCEWLGSRGDAPYPVPLLCGAFMACRRNTWEVSGGFDDGMEVYGSEDLEYSLRLWLLGYRQLLVPRVEVAHLFRSKHPYQVNWEAMLYNKLRMGFAHLGVKRLEQLLAAEQASPAFAAAMARLADSDIWLRRLELAARRKHDDEWFFSQQWECNTDN